MNLLNACVSDKLLVSSPIYKIALDLDFFFFVMQISTKLNNFHQK